MRKFNLSYEDYLKARVSEYRHAKSHPEECGPGILEIQEELVQYVIMRSIKIQAKSVRDFAKIVEQGLLDLNSQPIANLIKSYSGLHSTREQVDEIFFRLTDSNQESIKEFYKAFSNDTLRLMKSIEQRLASREF